MTLPRSPELHKIKFNEISRTPLLAGKGSYLSSGDTISIFLVPPSVLVKPRDVLWEKKFAPKF